MGRWEPSKPTIRQELFCRELLKNPVASHAYAKIYECNPKSATVGATRVLKKPHVRRRLNQLWRRQMKRSDITVDKILTDYQEAFDLARATKRAGDMIAASQAQAKLVGLLRERVETGNVGDFGDTTSIEGILEIVAKEAGEEAAMTLAAMFGLKLPESETTKQMKEAALFIADPPSEAVN